MDHDDQDWCSINEAARRLHVTPTAIRNRIKRGTLKTKPHGNHGRLVRAPLPVIPMVTLTGSGTVTPTMTDTGSGTVTVTVPDPLVPELRAQISQLEGRLKASQDELLAMAQRVGASESELVTMKAMLDEVRSSRDELRQERDRWAVQAHALAHSPGPAMTSPQRRGFLSWLRKWA